MVETEASWDAVGGRVRAIRSAAGISVRELARRIGVTPSHVSQVERGLGAFSVPALYAVARELGVPVQDLLNDLPESVPQEEPHPPYATEADLIADGVVLRLDDRPRIELSSGPRWSRLTAKPEPDAEFLQVVYAPGTDKSELHITHDGREYGVILSGVLTVEIDEVVTQLEAGDSIVFDSSRPHRFWNAGSEEVRAIWFVRSRPV